MQWIMINGLSNAEFKKAALGFIKALADLLHAADGLKAGTCWRLLRVASWTSNPEQGLGRDWHTSIITAWWLKTGCTEACAKACLGSLMPGQQHLVIAACRTWS